MSNTINSLSSYTKPIWNSLPRNAGQMINTASTQWRTLSEDTRSSIKVAATIVIASALAFSAAYPGITFAIAKSPTILLPSISIVLGFHTLCLAFIISVAKEEVAKYRQQA